MRQSTLLVISQVYVPDPASVGQHLHDVAAEIVKRGYRVQVLTSSRGYDAPEVRFPQRETVDSVEVIRLPLSSFGKRSIFTRLIAQISFLGQAFLRGLFTPGLRAILMSTSPPMCSVAVLAIAALRRVPVVYWVMDINPDQAIVLGAVRENSVLVWLFNVLNRTVLSRVHSVVTLDRFMAERLIRKRDISNKLEVFPPWPHEDHLNVVAHEKNPFRKKHGLNGKFVVMYSGNHSPANPVSTAIAAAERLQDRTDIVFMFIGGGTAKKEIEEAIARGARNIVSLPYQPLSELKHSLSAADAHLVIVGRSAVGIVHPCKVYGAMAVARPILFIGPKPSHVSDILEQCNVGRQVGHGDVEGAVKKIIELADMTPTKRAEMGKRARELIQNEFSKQVLCTRFGDIVEATLNHRTSPLFDAVIEERTAEIIADINRRAA